MGEIDAQPVGVGYFPKQYTPRPETLHAPGVEEICSVSECIAAGPPDWIQRWQHNDLGFYDTPALAWQSVSVDRADFRLFAYRVYPLAFDLGAVRAWAAPVQAALELDGFEFLGFDLVSRSTGTYCECSALSCNGGAAVFPVNRYCLMTDLAAAYDACVEVSRGGYEPGPYHLFEVYRQSKGVES